MNLAEALIAFVADVAGPFLGLVEVVCWVMGLFLVLLAALRLLKHSDSFGKGAPPSALGTLATLLSGVVLLQLPAWMNALTITFFGTAETPTRAVLGYGTPDASFDELLGAVFTIVALNLRAQSLQRRQALGHRRTGRHAPRRRYRRPALLPGPRRPGDPGGRQRRGVGALPRQRPDLSRRWLAILAGIALFGRAFAARRLEAWIFTATAAVCIAAALLFSATVPALMVEWGMAPALDAVSAWSYLLGVSLLFGALLLVRRHLIRLHASRTCSLGAPLCAATAIIALTVTPALAISLGEMAEEAGQDLEVVPFFISVAFYILGILIVGFGLIRLKRHVDQPSQTTMGSGIVALIIGVALLAAPSVINAIGETFGVDATATISRPALD